MKSLVVFALLGFAPFASANSADPRSDLDSVVCAHWAKPDQDADLNVTFKYEDNDFANVTINQSFTSRYTHDTVNAEILKVSAQVQAGAANFSIDDLAGFSIVLKRPLATAAEAKKPNATLNFGNGVVVKLVCWKQ